MEQLTQTISNLVGILMGLVGAVGVGFFVYGAYMYLTASRSAPNQMERGKSAMMTAVAGIVLAMVAYGVVDIVMNAVVEPGRRHRPAHPGHADPDADTLIADQSRANGACPRMRRIRVGETTMREHEVPTHVQAEDKVLLWFTFPQVVAITAVGALAYAAYRYCPRRAVRGAAGAGRPSWACVGVAMTVGKVGGRRLPLAAADLLRFRLGPRRYAGPPAQLARSEPLRASREGARPRSTSWPGV